MAVVHFMPMLWMDSAVGGPALKTASTLLHNLDSFAFFSLRGKWDLGEPYPRPNHTPNSYPRKIQKGVREIADLASLLE